MRVSSPGEPVAGDETRATASLDLIAADGSTARLEPWPGHTSRTGPDLTPPDLGRLQDWVTHSAPEQLVLILVRRGGYAVGLADHSGLIRHHCGTRYVQGKTKAGGWSQQRFARRRSNQADALIGSVLEKLATLLVGQRPDGLVLGGDRKLCASVLAQCGDSSASSRLPSLPRREFYDLPDPRFAVLRRALERARAVPITLTEIEKETER